MSWKPPTTAAPVASKAAMQAPTSDPGDGLRLPHLAVGALLAYVARRWVPLEAAGILTMVGVVLMSPAVEYLQSERAKETLAGAGIALTWAAGCVVWPWHGTTWLIPGAVGAWAVAFVGSKHLGNRLARRKGRVGEVARAAMARRYFTRRKAKVLAPINARIAAHAGHAPAGQDSNDRVARWTPERITREAEKSFADYLTFVPFPRDSTFLGDTMTADGWRRSVRIPDAPVTWSPEAVAKQHAILADLPRPKVKCLQFDTEPAAIYHVQEYTVPQFTTRPPMPSPRLGLIRWGYNGRGVILETVIDERDDSRHVLIAGAPRSGKTAEARHLVTEWAANNAQFVFIDPKRGAAFGDFADAARMYANETNATEAAKWAVGQMHKRYDGLRTGARFTGPPLVIVTDEMQELDDDALAALSSLASVGAQANIVVISITQSPRAEVVGGTGGGKAKGLYPIRLVFRLETPDENRIAHQQYATVCDSTAIPRANPGRAWATGLPGYDPTLFEAWFTEPGNGLVLPAGTDRMALGAAPAGETETGPSANPPYAGKTSTDPADTGDETGETGPQNPPTPQGSPLLLGDRQAAVYDVLTGNPQTLADIAAAAGLDTKRCGEVLGQLRRRQYVEKLAHGTYRRTGPARG